MNIETEINLILNLLSDNSLINLVDDELFITKEIKELFSDIKDLYKRDTIVTIDTVNQFAIEAKKYKYSSFLNLQMSKSFEECIIILSKEYNKSLYLELIKRKDLYVVESEMIRELNNVLDKYKSPFSFNLTKNIDETINYLRNKSNNFFPIGVNSIDKFLEIAEDRFITIGGASGSGKTAFVIFMIDQLCRLYSSKIEVLFISLEMSEKRILSRLLSLHLREPIKKISQNIDNYLDKILDFRAIVKDYPLEILYTDLDIHKINAVFQAHINKAKHKKKIPILFLDHFGEVTGLDELSSKSNVDKITSSIKSFCKRGGCAFGLTQLRKDLKDKKNKDTWYKPSNSYIMNSQSVEARSDIIMHLWRPEHDGFNEIVYEEKGVIYEIDTRGSICLVNDKNRDDEKTEVWLNCDIATNYFEDINKNKIRIIQK